MDKSFQHQSETDQYTPRPAPPIKIGWSVVKKLWRLTKSLSDYRIPNLVHFTLDWAGLQKRPYRFGKRVLRPGMDDCKIFVEIFAGYSYGPAVDRIRKANVVVDIGGHLGFFAEWVKRENPVAQVHVFEPLEANTRQYPEVFARCRGIRIYEAAVGDAVAVVTITPHQGLSYASSYLAGDRFISPLSHGQQTIDVIDAADLFTRCNIGRIDVLKLDCEGAELGILERLQIVGHLKQIGAIIMEYHVPEQMPIICRLLQNAGFRVAPVDSYHRIIYAES